LACGELGEGKLLTPEEITAYVELLFAFGPDIPQLQGARILVSGGHTEEPLDGVRFLSNRSSGKTALAVARAFRLAGAEVHLVLGPVSEPAPSGVKLTRVKTSDEFHHAMHLGQLDSEAVVMVAAIADFVPKKTDPGKWKNSKSLKNIELSPSKNVLDELGRNKPKGRVLVGFALETEKPVAHGWEKLQARKCDLMVVNNPLSQAGAGFGEESVDAIILDAAKAPRAKEQLATMEKSKLAAELVQKVALKIRPAIPA
jgi:phosphopantothenoylcysteine decarboxylase/phosphopantothenate--cysteine ligase